MKEEDLLDLEFVKYEQDDEDDKFYYYVYDLKGKAGSGTLVSCTDDEVKDDKWEVYAWDINDKLVFRNIDDIEIYIDVLEKNIHEEEQTDT